MVLTYMQKAVFSLLLCTGLTLVAVSSPLAAAAEKKPGGKVPTNISASHMEYNANAQTVVFTGDVHVKRPDFELWAAKMTIYLDKSSKASANPEAGGMEAGEIDRIVAEKNVRMKSDAKQGTCDKATYYAKEDKFVMEGNPVLSDKDKSQIKGRRVIHYMSSNRSEIDGRVDAIFFAPDKTERQGNGKL